MWNLFKRGWFKFLRGMFRLDSSSPDWMVGWINTDVGNFYFCDSIPKSHWVADPFLFRIDNELYLFVEFFDKIAKKGSIAFSKLEDERFGTFQICLEENFHLSFPRILKIGTKMYLSVESSSSPGIRIYVSETFPHEWRLVTVLESSKYFLDPVLISQEGSIYIFATSKIVGGKNELLLYKTDSIESGILYSSPSNPITVTSRKSRNGGFFEEDGRYVRVAQYSYLGIYGFNLGFYQIEKPFNFYDFKERSVNDKILIKPHFAHQFHTVNKVDKYVVFDFKLK
jgi:hypothetical protein